MLLQIAVAQLRDTGLLGAEDLAGAAQAQIFLGDAEPVGGLAHHRQAAGALLGDLAAHQQEAVALAAAAPDAAAQLVELREAEAIGVEDRHHRRLRHVDPDLDHGGGDEHVELAVAERAHHLVALRRVQPAVHQADLRQLLGQRLRHRGGVAPLVALALAVAVVLVAADLGAHHEGALAGGHPLGDELDGVGLALGAAHHPGHWRHGGRAAARRGWRPRAHRRR